MKKNILNISIIAFSMLLFSCENAIDINQVGRVTADVAFENVQDLQDGLVGVYTRFDMKREVALAAYYTDETSEGTDSGGQGRTTGHIFNLTATSAASSTFWYNGYSRLNAVNRLIEAALLIDDSDEKNNILGQAYALRAFAHFQLLCYYSTDYADDNALAVILQESVPSVADKLLRNTNGEIYASIATDLSTADGLLTDELQTIYISKDFVLALRARIAAYRQDYAAAQPLAQTLLNKYPIASQIDYKLTFADAGTKEIIFKLQRDIGDFADFQGNSGSVATTGWIGNVFAFASTTKTGAPYMEIGRNLFNLISTDDVRYSVNVAIESTVAPDYTNTTNYREEDVLLVGKYVGKPGQPLLNDHKVFRSSEMLLIIAEAKAHNNDLIGAANDIQTLRTARYNAGTVPDLQVFASKQEAFAGILNERRVEFAFEGHRWKDLKRLGVRANQGVTRDPVDVEEFGFTLSLPADNYRFTLPIPVQEFQANPELRTQQNPGYND
jgi:hypothetical protein